MPCNAVPGHHHSKELSGIACCPPSPLSVRCFLSEIRFGSLLDDGEGLKLEVPFAQSAFSPLLSGAWLTIAVGIAPAAVMSGRVPLAS